MGTNKAAQNVNDQWIEEFAARRITHAHSISVFEHTKDKRGANTCLFRSEIPVWVEDVYVWSPELHDGSGATEKGGINMQKMLLVREGRRGGREELPWTLPLRQRGINVQWGCGAVATSQRVRVCLWTVLPCKARNDVLSRKRAKCTPRSQSNVRHSLRFQLQVKCRLTHKPASQPDPSRSRHVAAGETCRWQLLA